MCCRYICVTSNEDTLTDKIILMGIKNLGYFKETDNLIQRYSYFTTMIRETEVVDETFQRDIIELTTRIEQLDYLYGIIERLNYETAKKSQNFELKRIEWETENDIKNNPNIPFPKELNDLMDKCFSSMDDSFFIKLHFEQFYYIAGRIRKIVRYLPGIEKKFEAEGIRNVRNQIIEHPERMDFSPNGFNYGNAKGPIINTFRDDNNDIVYIDKGLFANAIEFKENLETVLVKNINKKEKIFRTKFVDKHSDAK